MEGQGSAARRILTEKCSKTTEKIKNEEARGCHLAEVNDQLRAGILICCISNLSRHCP